MIVYLINYSKKKKITIQLIKSILIISSQYKFFSLFEIFYTILLNHNNVSNLVLT